MESVTTLPRGRPLSRADLDTLPDDGRRHELIDGTLVVTPSPAPRHQDVVLALAIRLRERCPAGLKVLIAPLDVALAVDTVLQPDVLVARRADLTDRGLSGPPILAVEVLSPSTRHVDLMLKRARYESARCPSYWVIDPDQPSLTAWELHEGAYVEAGHAVGEEEYATQHPYCVGISPVTLLDD